MRKPRGLSTGGAFEVFFRLTLAVLEAFSGPGLAVLFTLAHTRIARQQTVRFERGPKINIRLQQSARDTVSHGARLPGRTAAIHTDLHVIFGGGFGDGERLADRHSESVGRKIVFKGT